MPSAKFTAQLIAMVTPEMKADIVKTARARDVSLSEEVRDRLDRAGRGKIILHHLLEPDPTIYPDADTEQDAVEQQARNEADRERFHQELGEPVQTSFADNVPTSYVERVRAPRVTDAELDERFRRARVGKAPRDSTRP